MRDKPLPFPRYVWCDTCHTFEEHTRRAAHEAAICGVCPKCGSRDLCSRPPEHHAKALARAAA